MEEALNLSSDRLLDDDDDDDDVCTLSALATKLLNRDFKNKSTENIVTITIIIIVRKIQQISFTNSWSMETELLPC